MKKYWFCFNNYLILECDKKINMKIRDLKKDVNSVFDFVIEECYTCLYYSPVVNYEYVYSILSEAIEKREEILTLINDNKKLLKIDKSKYFSNLTQNLFESSAELVDKLCQQN